MPYDLVLNNVLIVSPDADEPTASALAVTDGRKNSSKNSEPNLFKKTRTVLLCLRTKLLTQETRSIYFILYKLFFFEDPL